MSLTIRHCACAVAVLCALSACRGAATPSLSGGATPDRVAASVARRAAPSHPDHRKSWISPELKRALAPLLFVSDPGTADVYIYNLPTLKVVGTITGFSQPQGECSDNKGNVWVTDSTAKIVYELSHRGYLENELSETNPAACTWDSKTGSLAIMNLFGAGSSSGSVVIYARGSGSPRSYRNPAQYYYNFGGYDANGNLFFDGRDARGKFMLSELPKGANTAYTIKVTGGTIYFPGMVQWDSANHELVVGDQSCGNAYSSCLYSMTIANKTATVKAKISLQTYAGGHVCDLVQGVLYNGKIDGSDFNFCGDTPSTTYLWPYPAGGAPTAYENKTVSVPVGAAISK
jgi:hypothetical protein